MKDNPLMDKPGNTRLIYGSEVLLIIFAALLLLAAIPPATIDTNAVPVKVNMTTPTPAAETLKTAAVQNNENDIQTTALLTIEELPTNKTP